VRVHTPLSSAIHQQYYPQWSHTPNRRHKSVARYHHRKCRSVTRSSILLRKMSSICACKFDATMTQAVWHGVQCSSLLVLGEGLQVLHLSLGTHKEWHPLVHLQPPSSSRPPLHATTTGSQTLDAEFPYNNKTTTHGCNSVHQLPYTRTRTCMCEHAGRNSVACMQSCSQGASPSTVHTKHTTETVIPNIHPDGR
jgi:hypothetical protein